MSIGSVAGFYGGKVDEVLMWFLTVFWSLPSVLLTIAISFALHSDGLWVVFIAIGLTMWVDVARVTRGQFLEMKNMPFVESARALGYSDIRIMAKHILPNITGPLIVIATANFATAILLEAGLSFLGLGVKPPAPSWGSMIREGFNLVGNSGGGYLLLIPAVAISLLVLGFNLMGNGLRDVMDPKHKKRR
jgi:peptide/nickel transport system permease protein